MEVFIEKTKVKKTIMFEGKTGDLLLKLKINPETVIVVRDNELVTEEEMLVNKNKVKIMSVISGG